LSVQEPEPLTSEVEIQEPKKSPQTADYLLSEREREQANKLGANPIDLIGTTESKAYIIGLIEETLPTSKFFQNLAASYASPVGSWLIVPEDLTAQTGEYVYTDSRTGLRYLYCNGAAVSQATYADLYAYWGASKWAADSGGNFSLPDSRGRELLLCGTHADCDLGDTIGPATESSRRGSKHGHAVTSLTVTGSPGAGSLAVGSESAHTHGAGSFAVGSGGTHSHTYTGYFSGGGGSEPGRSGASSDGSVTIGGDGSHTHSFSGTSAAGSSHTHSLSGSPSAGTLDVGGTVGTDTNEGGAGIFIGSLLVRI